MKVIGINTFLFTSPFTSESIGWLDKFAGWGFDSVEIAIENPEDIDAALIKKALERNKFSCDTVCAVMMTERDLRGTSDQQQSALKYLKGTMDVMEQIGAKMLVGPLYSSVGRADAVADEDYKTQWSTVVRHLKELCDYAKLKGLTLALEPLNRFETDFINTCAQGLRLISDVNKDNLFIHLDTFHMNIEEKDLATAIRKAGKKLGLLHACGTDRGTPGNDHTDWNKIVKALKDINYDGQLVIESFTKDVKSIARAAAIWRDIEISGEEIAVKGLAFLRSIQNYK
jgi:D-psicose/D-tagatose/L-ribulose 3-epimerase